MLDGGNVLIRKAKVVLLSVIAAMAYGIIHDQITARLCVEYFTVAHPALFHTVSPTLLGIAWGIAGTFGSGLLLGVLLAQASQSRSMPPMPVSNLCKPIFLLLGTMSVAAALAGLVGFELSRRSIISLAESWRELLPPSQYDRFMAVSYAHCASYLSGLGGGAYLILRIWNQRNRPGVFTIFPRTKYEVLRTALIVVIMCVIIWLRFLRSAH